MRWIRRLFDFKGAASRLEYVLVAGLYLLSVGLWLVGLRRLGDAGLPLLVAGILLVPVGVTAWFAATYRRLHDRNKRGSTWIALFYIAPSFLLSEVRGGSLAGSAVIILSALALAFGLWAWAFVELALMPRVEPNRFAGSSDRAAVFD